LTSLSEYGKLFAMNTLDFGTQWAFWHIHDSYFLPVLLGPAVVH